MTFLYLKGKKYKAQILQMKFEIFCTRIGQNDVNLSETTCIYFIYLFIHSFSGLELPGFFHGSNFLLPWDITVRMERDKWPGLGEANKKSKQKRVPKGQLFHTVSLSAHQDVRGEVTKRQFYFSLFMYLFFFLLTLLFDV